MPYLHVVVYDLTPSFTHMMIRTVSEERFDGPARRCGSGGPAHIFDDLADELCVGVRAVGVLAVEVERGCYLELVFSEEGIVQGSAVEYHVEVI